MPLLNKHNLELAKLASKEENRFLLQGILVQPESTVVTDGQVLMEVTTADFRAADFPQPPGIASATDEWKPFVLSAQDALAIAKTIPKKTTTPILSNAAVATPNGDDHMTIFTTDLERHNPVTVRKLTGTYPDYKRVIWPAEEAEFAINVNARNLADVLDFVAKFNESKRSETQPPDCVLRFKSNREAIRIDARVRGGDQKLTALVGPANFGVTAGLDSTPGVIKEYKSAKAAKDTGGLARATTAREIAEARLTKLKAQVAELEKELGS